ncbi:reverse transcriptase domain-containing protein [Tanacetum coccineum]
MNDKSKDTTKARHDLKNLGMRSELWLGQNKNRKCSKPQAKYSFTPENKKKFCLFVKGIKLPDGFGSNFKHKQICSRTLMEADMVKAQRQVIDILYNLELIHPHAFFDIMIHLVIHLPLEALEGGAIPPVDTRQRYINKDLGVSESGDLFTLACGPTSSPISVNYCVVNGVRFVVHSRDERRTTQNNDICSPSEKDGEMYYGQLEEILEFSYMSFKVVLFRVKWFDTSNEGLKIKRFVIRNNITQIWAHDITDVDEDDDLIDDEDTLPHDLADSDDKDFTNDDDDDDVAIISADEVTMVTVVMIVPLHIRQGYPKTQQWRQEIQQTRYPRANQEPRVNEDNGSIGPAADPGVPDALPFLAQDPGGAKGEGSRKH